MWRRHVDRPWRICRASHKMRFGRDPGWEIIRQTISSPIVLCNLVVSIPTYRVLTTAAPCMPSDMIFLSGSRSYFSRAQIPKVATPVMHNSSDSLLSTHFTLLRTPLRLSGFEDWRFMAPHRSISSILACNPLPSKTSGSSIYPFPFYAYSDQFFSLDPPPVSNPNPPPIRFVMNGPICEYPVPPLSLCLRRTLLLARLPSINSLSCS